MDFSYDECMASSAFQLNAGPSAVPEYLLDPALRNGGAPLDYDPAPSVGQAEDDAFWDDLFDEGPYSYEPLDSCQPLAPGPTTPPPLMDLLLPVPAPAPAPKPASPPPSMGLLLPTPFPAPKPTSPPPSMGLVLPTPPPARVETASALPAGPAALATPPSSGGYPPASLGPSEATSKQEAPQGTKRRRADDEEVAGAPAAKPQKKRRVVSNVPSCAACRRSKLKCEFAADAAACKRCTGKGLPCERSTTDCRTRRTVGQEREAMRTAAINRIAQVAQMVWRLAVGVHTVEQKLSVLAPLLGEWAWGSEQAEDEAWDRAHQVLLGLGLAGTPWGDSQEELAAATSALDAVVPPLEASVKLTDHRGAKAREAAEWRRQLSLERAALEVFISEPWAETSVSLYRAGSDHPAIEPLTPQSFAKFAVDQYRLVVGRAG